MQRPDRPKRKHIPLSVKIEACLLAMGLDPRKVQWDHDPALGLRPVNDAGTDYDPPQLDPKHIVPREILPHRQKTTGRRGESDLSISGNGDVSRIRKAERLEEARLERARREMLRREAVPEHVQPKPKYRWPQGRKLQSRGFQKRREKSV